MATASSASASFGELPFASCYAYAPNSVCESARRLRTSVKKGDVRALLGRALRLDAADGPAGRLVRFFPDTAVLVAVPGSEPRRLPHTTPAGRLAIALLHEGLGQNVWFGLRRIQAVRKSATAPPGARPTVRTHYDTMSIDALDSPGFNSIVLVDDVVSRGRTLLASALRVWDLMPCADVRAFALLRTVAFAPVERLLTPCIGMIEWRREDARRTP